MEERIWKVAAYARLSREDGDKEESNSIGSQREIIRDYVSKHPELSIVQEYVDDGYSGVNFDRPGFQAMMADLKARRVDCIVCKDLSRFSRDYINGGRYLEKIFPDMGVRLIAINDNIDSCGVQSHADAFLIPIKNIINDAYSRDISMKIRSQLDVKRKKGDFIGAFASYGYKKDPDDKNRLIVDEEAAQVVEMIFRLRIKGVSNDGIAQRLNEMGVLSPMEYKLSQGMNYRTGFRTSDREQSLWSAHTIRRVLTNPIYIGTLTQHTRGTPNYKVKRQIQYDEKDWIVVPHNHPPIISQTDYDTVQSLLKRNVRVAPEQESAPLFSGFVYCGDCGYQMTRKITYSNDKKYPYLVCSTFKAGQGCSSHCFSEPKLEQVVLKIVQQHINQVGELNRMLNYIATLPESKREIINYDAQIGKLEGEIQRYREKQLKLYDDLADGFVSKEEYQRFYTGYERRIAAAQCSIYQVQEDRAQAVRDNEEEIPWVQMFLQYENIKEVNRMVLVNLVERIVIYKAKRVEVDFRYQDKYEKLAEYVHRFESIMEV